VERRRQRQMCIRDRAYRWYAQTEEEARNNFLAFCLGVFKDSVKNRL
jgi:hypothetical protein